MLKTSRSKAPFAKNKNKNIIPKNTPRVADDEVIEKYQMYLEVERNYSGYTVLNYIHDIKEFKEFLSSNDFGNLLTIDKTNIARYYISYLSEKNYKKKVLQEKFLVLEVFIDI